MLDHFKARQDDLTDLLISLIQHESFTPEKTHVDHLVDFIAATVERLRPSSVTRISQETVGDILLVKWNETAPGEPVMVLMHTDTVHPIGTINEMPIRTDDNGRLYGPGAVDMKGGIAVALAAMQGLTERDERPDRPIWYLFTSDEETGSLHAMPHIEANAAKCGLVLVMEFPTDAGALKTARKGVATYTLRVTGHAAHAGNHPEAGVNAVLELAEQIVHINGLQDLRGGISVAVNTVEGGVASNVIAPRAQAEIDVRTVTQPDMDNIHHALTNLRPRIPGAQVEVELHHMRGPMERDEQMIATFKQAQHIARSIGLTVYEDSVGGGSDGNLTAGFGIATLDGLGPRGGGPHTDSEYVILRSLPERAAHIAAMLRDWSF